MLSDYYGVHASLWILSLGLVHDAWYVMKRVSRQGHSIRIDHRQSMKYVIVYPISLLVDTLQRRKSNRFEVALTTVTMYCIFALDRHRRRLVILISHCMNYAMSLSAAPSHPSVPISDNEGTCLFPAAAYSACQPYSHYAEHTPPSSLISDSLL